jgi:hypothetical protein
MPDSFMEPKYDADKAWRQLSAFLLKAGFVPRPENSKRWQWDKGGSVLQYGETDWQDHPAIEVRAMPKPGDARAARSWQPGGIEITVNRFYYIQSTRYSSPTWRAEFHRAPLAAIRAAVRSAIREVDAREVEA